MNHLRFQIHFAGVAVLSLLVGCGGTQASTAEPAAQEPSSAQDLSDASIDSPWSSTFDGGVTCADYCRAQEMQCTGTDSQYATTAECNKVCNSIGQSPTCLRAYTNTSCSQGAPFGEAGMSPCGSDRCKTFCRLAEASCPGAFSTAEVCEAQCAAWPLAEAVIPGKPTVWKNGSTIGPSFNCRSYYLSKAFSDPMACPNVTNESAACAYPDSGL